MLVLARHEGESVIILDGMIRVKVLSITGKIVRLGIDAPREISVMREEKNHAKKDDQDGLKSRVT